MCSTPLLLGRTSACVCKRMGNGSPLLRGGPASMLAGRRDPVGHGPDANGPWTAHNERAQRCDALGSMCSSSHASTPSKPSRHSSGLWIVRGIVSPRLRCCSNAAGASHRWWSRATRIGRCRSNSNGQNADPAPPVTNHHRKMLRRRRGRARQPASSAGCLDLPDPRHHRYGGCLPGVLKARRILADARATGAHERQLDQEPDQQAD
jgi:hypothetical protein